MSSLLFSSLAVPLALFIGLQGAPGSEAPALPVSLDAWKNDLPFRFKYSGQESSRFLPSWKRSEESTPAEGGRLYRCAFSDPATKLKVAAEIRTFADFDAIDWVLNFTNEGTSDSPIIEDIQPLHWTLQRAGDSPLLHWALGSSSQAGDFEPRQEPLPAGKDFTLSVQNGRSSDNTLPFFNLQETGVGLIGAIGWTGNWVASFHRDATSPALTLSAGLPKTHFLLHPGESVRSPRILLLNYRGADFADAQNLWRRLVLTFYSPRDPQGKTILVPLSMGTWGTELISAKLQALQRIRENHIPYDVFWVDAGWYGTESPKPGATVDTNSPWFHHRGTWTPDPTCYPRGLKPLGDAVHEAGLRFLLWLEAEQADAGSKLLTQHPDWFFLPPNTNNEGTALLNLGNPEALKGITDLVSGIISSAGVDWYRQDFNVDPIRSWLAADAPDRIGISEIKHITGLYEFWDTLRKRHPGLQIDNCASGGRRLDLETMSRSVALWRTDFECTPFDPRAGQSLTESLNAWVPLNAGCYGGVTPNTPESGANLIYALRSNYSAGLDNIPAGAVAKQVADEFVEVRPFFMGDFYPLTAHQSPADLKAPVIWQWSRSDLHSGVVLLFRRPQCHDSVFPLKLRSIDPAARYEVEVRTGWEKGDVQQLTGDSLTKLPIRISEQPGSALVFYKEL